MRIKITKLPKNRFDIGGVLQSHGSDWSDGLITIDAGLSHEENPNEGVQLGIDNEGIPNLVEENETIFNDYVFSNRILADEATKQLFKLPKKKDITYADISKRLEKEIAERPNDPISKSSFEKQMQMLEEQQERQKQEMEAERAKEAFEALSPEEKVAVLQQYDRQQEAMAQQALQQQAVGDGQIMQQLSPEEAVAAQQMADGSVVPSRQNYEGLAELQQNISALGGRLVRTGDVEPNKFKLGGRKARKLTRKYDEDWFKQMAKSLGITDTEMKDFNFNSEDPEANLNVFNQIYKNNQYNKARDTYRQGQRQSKRNELFGDNGLYSYSDDNSRIYKARINDSDRIGWINKDYTGAVTEDGNLAGFLSQEEYDKLKPEEKEAYRRINEKAGDRMYDYNGRSIKDLYQGSEDSILDAYDYNEGFKWNDRDALSLQYPAHMNRSDLSYLRYLPALGGAFGLAYNVLTPSDYSRATGMQDIGNITPMRVSPNYNPIYLTYRPMDVLAEQNRQVHP